MVIRVIILALLALLLNSCGLDEDMIEEGAFNADSYTEMRAEKDAYFESEDSPLPSNERDHFKGLRYWKPSADYVVNATMELSEDDSTIEIPTTKDDMRQATRYGVLRFTVDGTECELTAYQFAGSDGSSLFVPFKDETTGARSYPTGRYLDIEREEGNEYVIDFNNAYNPFCAYNDRYSCPLVPSENTLDVSIEAGEGTWNH